MDRFQFKILLAVFMLLDHITVFIGGEASLWIHMTTRFVAVGFAYLAVEGLYYTRDIKKYLTRIYISAGVMALGNYFIGLLFKSKEIVVYNNIFLTLAAGLTAVSALKYLNNTGLKILILALLSPFILISEGGFLIIPFMILTYFLKEKPGKLYLSYLILSAVMFFTEVAGGPMGFKYSVLLNSDFLFITVIPLLMIYNHRKGSGGEFFKYFFYLFYPLHLWMIAAIRFFTAQ